MAVVETHAFSVNKTIRTFFCFIYSHIGQYTQNPCFANSSRGRRVTVPERSRKSAKSVSIFNIVKHGHQNIDVAKYQSTNGALIDLKTDRLQFTSYLVYWTPFWLTNLIMTNIQPSSNMINLKLLMNLIHIIQVSKTISKIAEQI